jgi:ubiquinone/menaquinone biosynthesis C-methylase UbiE
MKEIQQDVYRYWNDHVMGTQFLEGEGIEIASEEYFEQLHPIMFRHEYLLPLITEEAEELNGRKLLEVGCGMGFDAIEWIKRGVEVTAIDIAPSAIKMARQHFAIVEQQANLGVGSALNLPFPDNTFDAIYSRGVLHMTGDTPRAIAEVYRVVKPGGRVIVVNLYNRYSWFVLLHKLGRENIEFHEEDAPVTSLYSLGEIKKLFSAFSSLEVRKEHYYPYKTRRRGIKASLFNNVFYPLYRTLPTFVARPFGFKFVITGNKPI